MVANISDILSAYKKTGGIMDDAGSGMSNAPVSGAGTFADALSSFAGDAVGTIHEGEKAAMASASGVKTDLASVATAISKAEIVLDEVVAIRDKVISAYQAITSGAI